MWGAAKDRVKNQGYVSDLSMDPGQHQQVRMAGLVGLEGRG